MNNNETDISSKERELAECLKKNLDMGGPMSEKEKAFLRDVEGLVRFAIRNGLSFRAIVRVLYADLSHFAHNELSYDNALADGYLPMVTGYSKLSPESFGETEEEETVAQ
jgi:hypothetical protein